MSVETSIDNLLSTLKSLSSGYAGTAYSLVQSADDRLKGLSPPEVGEVDYRITRDRPDYTPVKRPPTIGELEKLVLPTPGTLQSVNQAYGQFTGKAPTLKLPTFKYSELKAPPTFSEKSPAPAALTINPILPTLVNPEAPIFTAPTEISVDPISGDPPPDVPLPEFMDFEGDFHDEYSTGWAFAAPEVADAISFFSRIRDALPLFEQPVTEIISGAKPGLPEAWETQSYAQALQDINAATFTAADALDQQPSSITGLPTGAMVYARLNNQLKAMQAATQAAGEVAIGRQKQEVKHLETALELCSKTITAATELKAQAVGWKMKGLMLAMDGAQGALDLALKLLALKEREMASLEHYNDTQLRRTEDLLKIEMAKLEALKIEVANSQLKSTFNEQQLKIYRIAEGFVETTIKLFQTQVEYIEVDMGLKKLAMEAFQADLSAYQAQIKANQSGQDLLRATIKGDTALVEGEMAKVKQLEAELLAKTAAAKALSAQVKAIASDNKTKLALYNETVEAKLAELKAFDQNTMLVVESIVKGLAAENAELELALKSQEQKDQAALHDASLELEYDQIDLMNQLKQYEVVMDRLTAQSKIISQGASTLGSISTQAFSGLNAVAAKEIVESA